MKCIAILSLCLLGGCSTLSGPEYAVFDEVERANRISYDVTDSVDRVAIAPLARGYKKITPNWLERGVSNFFLNLRTLDSSVNGFLQGKVSAGSTDFARLLINSTVGVGGFFDVAGHWGLRYQDEDFGQTLAVWGYRRSRYIFVPFLGPTTVRDLPSTLVRSATPRLVFGADYRIGYSALDLLSVRADTLGATEARDSSALDPYAFTRDAFYQRRKFQILDGELPDEDLFDEFEEDWE